MVSALPNEPLTAIRGVGSVRLRHAVLVCMFLSLVEWSGHVVGLNKDNKIFRIMRVFRIYMDSELIE